MESRLMTLFTRTPLHVGAGNSVGVVDSPIQRERHTRIPIIPGSSLKGVLADMWLEKNENGKLIRSKEGVDLFGEESSDQASAGALLIGEARVLAFPVRSASNGFAWLTSPFALERFGRDSGKDLKVQPVSENEKCFAADGVSLNNKVVLEEYCFERQGEVEKMTADTLSGLINDKVWNSVCDRLVVVTDEIFSYFCEHACEVVSRIRVNDETGTVDSGALFNQEQVPSETLFYSMIYAENATMLKTLDKIDFLQVGGDETTGLGYCTVEVKK